MTDPHLRRTSGQAAAFLLRRIALAAHAAVLLAVLALLLLATAGALLVRIVVVRLWVVVTTGARVILRRVRVLRRGSPPAAEHNRARDRRASPMSRRWLPAAQQGTLLALTAKLALGRGRQPQPAGARRAGLRACRNLSHAHGRAPGMEASLVSTSSVNSSPVYSRICMLATWGSPAASSSIGPDAPS